MVKHLGLDLLRSMRPAKSSPYKMVLMRPDGCIEPGVRPPTCVNELWNIPRQALPAAYQGDGYIDITRSEVILKYGSMFGVRTIGYLIAKLAVDIDHGSDLKQA